MRTRLKSEKYKGVRINFMKYENPAGSAVEGTTVRTKMRKLGNSKKEVIKMFKDEIDRFIKQNT